MSQNDGARQRILNAAASLFAEYGFHETPIDRIAELANVAKGSIYYHFRGKDDLLAQLVEDGFSLIRKAVEHPVGVVSQPQQRLKQLIRSHFRLLVEYYDLARVIFHDARPSLDPDALARIDDAQRRYQSFLEDLIASGVQAGVFRDLDPKVVAAMLSGGLMAAAGVYLSQNGGDGAPEESAERAAEIFLRGIMR